MVLPVKLACAKASNNETVRAKAINPEVIAVVVLTKIKAVRYPIQPAVITPITLKRLVISALFFLIQITDCDAIITNVVKKFTRVLFVARLLKSLPNFSTCAPNVWFFNAKASLISLYPPIAKVASLILPEKKSVFCPSFVMVSIVLAPSSPASSSAFVTSLKAVLFATKPRVYFRSACSGVSDNTLVNSTKDMPAIFAALGVSFDMLKSNFCIAVAALSERPPNSSIPAPNANVAGKLNPAVFAMPETRCVKSAINPALATPSFASLTIALPNRVILSPVTLPSKTFNIFPNCVVI